MRTFQHQGPGTSLRRFVAVFALLLAALPAAAGDVAMIHDIPAGHIRLPYFDTLAAHLSRAEDGLTVTLNPGNRIHLGRDGLEAVRTGVAQMGWVNTAHIEAAHPRVGFINLPFGIDDRAMADPRVRDGVIDLINESIGDAEIRVIGLMRAADQIFVFKDIAVRQPEAMRGRRVRVAGTGVYEQIMRALGATPVAVPPREIRSAVEAGAVDGVFTSPGGWESTVGMAAPNASLVPGLMFITYSLVVNRAWYDALPAETRARIAAAARADVTDRWIAMRDDDRRLVEAMIGRGASYTEVSPKELAPWKERVGPVAQAFRERFPETAARFAALLQPVR